MGSYEPVVALMRGLEILRCLNEEGAATVGQLHARTGFAKPTIVRILETLIHTGYVQALGAERRYAVTAGVLALSNGYDAQTRLLDVACPILDTYRQALGWPIELGVFDTDTMVILNTSREPGFLSINRRPGSRVPVLRTALGRAYLAALAPEVLEKVLSRLSAKPGADFDLARQAADVHAMLSATRRRGYSVADTETLSNGRALACAIRHNGLPVASVNIVVHVSAMSLSELEEKFGGPIQSIAQEIAKVL
ncbi:IclR family transcriptional regulator domain-containing protein [Pollutimonas bauzanensis]|uniref:Transcriptional regulator, IclR family n=1 Tax=Pollutimonas bauzanensis TaxID=658167 RepID=A0A1M5Z969_9BURK|nr:IclR family transcriptional regulator C-terminal domain-containing protein [Pollutimonas bauzanensis]SHI20771.1 transcriptional regulator, IclR family [Pollutimonas bauzanensis]